MPRGISKCPNCGQPVSPFAAGCAVCGADLEAARAKLAARRRPELPGLGGFSIQPGSDGFQVVVAFLLALFVSPLGLALALYWANQRRNRGDTTMTIVMLGAAALALAALVAPVWFWSHVY